MKRHPEQRHHKGVDQGDRDDAEGVRDHCHTRAGLGVAAKSLGEDDGVQLDDPDWTEGANQMSLNEAKQAYKEGKEIY